jgi:hypothetical protein
MKGYNDKIARINLSSRKIIMETPSESFYRQYLGGRGIIVHTLLKEVPPKTDPFAPENKLVFALGPISGHPFVGSGRHSVGCKSPLSGGYGESEAGGYWGAELKKSGFDALIIEGAAAISGGWIRPPPTAPSRLNWMTAEFEPLSSDRPEKTGSVSAVFYMTSPMLPAGPEPARSWGQKT